MLGSNSVKLHVTYVIPDPGHDNKIHCLHCTCTCMLLTGFALLAGPLAQLHDAQYDTYYEVIGRVTT